MKSSLLVLICCTVIGVAAGAQAAPSPTTKEVAQDANPSTFDTSERLSREAVGLYKQGKYREALPIAARALELLEKAENPDGVKIAVALSNLAAVHQAIGNDKDAKPLLERAARLYAARPDAEPLHYGQTLKSLAVMETAAREYGKAESLYEQAIQIEERKLGPVHPNLGLPLLKLAELAHHRRDFKKAKMIFGRALDAYDNLPRPVPEYVAEALESYTCKIMDVQEADQMDTVRLRIGHITADPLPPEIEPTADIPPAEKRIWRGGVLNGKAISKAAPEYPAEAKRIGAQGVVLVKIVVDETGRVSDAQAVCGYDVLRTPSIEAVRRWRFTPTLLSGMPVRASGVVTVNYVLR